MLTDLNYEKTQKVLSQGQFSIFGDTINIYPILYDKIFQIIFLGNYIEEIKAFEPPKDSLGINKQAFKKKIEDKLLSRLISGEYVVHLDHGIGIFKGFVFKKNKKYFEIKYAKNDTLFVPINLSEKLSPYIGFSKPTIHRLGGLVWSETKKKVKKEVEKLAKELLSLHARRASLKRRPFGPDDEFQKNFENAFPFELTPDQNQALTEIKKSLQTQEYIDYLLCGDVGFGKTEVAFRIAYKTILEGYQVALMAPTMILVDQHFRVACQRFKDTGVKIESLSRAVNKEKQLEILNDLAQGKIDFIIGTHRLLSQDVNFKNLGLLIVDEEQKFGVKQKEKLRHFRGATNILSLSATPIPRTLHLALGGIWQMSNILTPPLGKQKTETFIGPYSFEKIKKAIESELARGGQIYYLYNRIAKLAFKKQEIEKMISGIRIAILHAQMPEMEILNILHNFEKRKYDMLLATTVIENGLDLPSVNTLIVENAQKLGLAQMHQIRGRIGRKDIKSYAYFFYDKDRLTFQAKQRLKYIKRFQELGDGYFIALKDLELRGAGNILGKEQSGYISAVGLNLYSYLLEEAINQIKAEQNQ
jgi:transcription-repair coupling factor (superfamily II helicase)